VNGGTTRRRPVVHRRPTASTVRELYGTALRCGRPGCMQALYRVSDTGARVPNSQVAHIHARRENGPRWDPAMTEEENRSYGNLILLCLGHASEIDATPDLYPAEVLREWKRVQVAAQEQAAKSLPPMTSAEADEVIRLSFGPDDLAAAVATAVPTSARSRSRDQALDLAVRQSTSRRTSRLLAVPPDRQDAVLTWMSENADSVVDVPEGQVRVLAGPMGAGKSELASRWWDEGLYAAQADGETEIPVWLEARRATAGLEAAVTSSIGRDPERPCRVVIDNLDGVPPRDANCLLDEARQLVRTWPRARVLATSRPGTPIGKAELIKVASWAPGRGMGLVRVITGNVRWYPETLETADLLTSPLTAIAVAARLLEGRDVQVPRLVLLRDLAQSILEQKRPDRAVPAVWDELARLAVRVLSSPAPVTAASFGSEALVWQLTDTGLAVRDGGSLRFVLPLFEQHFGAQALKSGLIMPETAAGPEAFPRWRYAVAFAAASSEPQEADHYMQQIACANPGAVSWVLNEITDDKHPRSAGTPGPAAAVRPADGADPAVAEAGRLREALQSLTSGFGACGPLLSRHRDGRLVQWGAQLHGDMLALSEARSAIPPPAVVVVEDQPGGRMGPEWIRRTLFPVPRGPFGRWSWARNRLREPLAELIRKRRLPLPPDSPLARERQWVLARQVMRVARRWDETVIPLAELRQALDPMMEKVESSVLARWSGGGVELDSHDIRWLKARVDRENGDHLCRPWPAPDRPNPAAKWQWQLYTPELTLAIMTEVLRAAVTGYQDLVQENFAGFGRALGLNSVMPACVEGSVIMPADDTDGQRSGLRYQLKPSPAAITHVNLNLLTQPEVWQPPRFADMADDRIKAPFYMPAQHNPMLPTGQTRPATNLAYEWLASDLLALGWLDRVVRFYD